MAAARVGLKQLVSARDGACSAELSLTCEPLGVGRSCEVFRLRLREPLPGLEARGFALARQRVDAPDDPLSPRRQRLELAAHVVEALADAALPFRRPIPALAFEHEGASFLLRAYLRGDPLTGSERCEPIARCAAALHRLELGAWIEPLAALPRWGRDRESTLSPLRGVADRDALIAQTLGWLEQHSPSRWPRALLHADLATGNLLNDPASDPPLALIDWEYARLGHPALELALVCRGRRRVLGDEHGRARLLEVYSRAGGLTINARDVRFFELAWLARAIALDREGGRSGHAVRARRHRLRRWLRRASLDRA